MSIVVPIFRIFLFFIILPLVIPEFSSFDNSIVFYSACYESLQPNIVATVISQGEFLKVDASGMTNVEISDVTASFYSEVNFKGKEKIVKGPLTASFCDNCQFNAKFPRSLIVQRNVKSNFGDQITSVLFYYENHFNGDAIEYATPSKFSLGDNSLVDVSKLKSVYVPKGFTVVFYSSIDSIDYSTYIVGPLELSSVDILSWNKGLAYYVEIFVTKSNNDYLIPCLNIPSSVNYVWYILIAIFCTVLVCISLVVLGFIYSKHANKKFRQPNSVHDSDAYGSIAFVSETDLEDKDNVELTLGVEEVKMVARLSKSNSYDSKDGNKFVTKLSPFSP